MEPEMLKIDKFLDGARLKFIMRGRLDALTSRMLRAQLDEALSSQGGAVRSLAFDFKALEYISTAGLREVLYGYKRMLNYGEFIVYNAQGFVLEVIGRAGFDKILVLDYDEADEYDEYDGYGDGQTESAAVEAVPGEEDFDVPEGGIVSRLYSGEEPEGDKETEPAIGKDTETESATKAESAASGETEAEIKTESAIGTEEERSFEGR
jgi:anti-sigma B factor antagonist